MKLADLNRDFFKKQFDVLLSNESLNQFTAEERRQLYVDFRLGQRRVELGFCAKKLSEGGCKNRNRLYHCVACQQLCTGKSICPIGMHCSILRSRQYKLCWKPIGQKVSAIMRILWNIGRKSICWTPIGK